MKPFLIGRYQLGWRMVNLWAEPELLGGNFNLCRNRQDAQIHIGMDHRDPAEVFAVLCHEVWEMVMDELCCALTPKAFEPNASDTYQFHFNHNQHTEISSRASYFVWQCMDDFKKAHAKCRKAKKRNR